MKILINPYPHIFQNKGGIQKRVLEHQRLLLEKNYQIEIFNPSISVKKFDILTTFKPQYGNYDVFLEAKRNRLKTVTHVIHELPNNYLQYLVSKYTSKIPFFISNFRRKIIENSDALIALSDSEKSFLVKKYNVDEAKIFVVPNAINTNLFIKEKTTIFLEKYNINEPYILSVGRIEQNKNQLSIAEAIKDLGIKLILIGEKIDKEYVKEIEQYDFVQIIEDITYSSEELISAYKNSSLFILASFKEISPNTVIEAALCNIPLICTSNTFTIKQYFKDEIEYINPNSIGDIKSKVKKVLSNEEVNKSIKEIALNNFSEEKVIERHLKIYNSL
ncbi:glycosyltransferase family 4 protein [Flavobacterium limnosediminis]|uniref:glycosyltransferase family 4 protein n=1 Tax=Flavobacterium limnosediminis TaxID=1401027 RepID=UPI00040EF484|nr:glycosyltransferase family 4 protein [Flavobacterium limnosediminis]